MQPSRLLLPAFISTFLLAGAGCGDDSEDGATGGSSTGSTSSSTSSASGSSSSSSGATGGTGATGGEAVGGEGGLGGEGGRAAGGSGGVGGAGGNGGAGGGGNVSNQIATVIATADGGGLSLPVQGAFVTYLKPLLGQDAAGFFVQGEQSGPAIFLAVDPATLTPVPAVGDEVDFTVTDLTTSAGLKQVTGISGFAVVSSGNPIDPLVTDVSAAADLVSNLSSYESRAIKITGTIAADFVTAGAPQVAAQFTTAGLTDPDLRIRMPEAVRAQFDLEAGCSFTVDYGVMWRFNSVAQPSALYAADLTQIACAAPTVIGAIALSNTEVMVSFDRNLDPASVNEADFTFDQGLTTMLVSVTGADVHITTSAQAGGLTYTVTAANLTDVLGTALGTPNSAMFLSYVPSAKMLLNEINPNISNSFDLVEMLVTQAGSTAGIQLIQLGGSSDPTTLATLPDVSVSAGDLIVIHQNGTTAPGAAPGSETTSKNQHSSVTYSANYDGAWDFHGAAVGLTYGNRALRLQGPGGVDIDAVPVVQSMAMGASGFPAELQALQAAGLWFPANCGGSLCTYTSTPTAVEISVDYFGVGTTPTGNSISRKPGANSKQKSDWNAAAAQSFGLPNP